MPAATRRADCSKNFRTPLEDGIQAIYNTSRHLSEFVANYRKMSELEKPILTDVQLRPLLDDVCRAYPQLIWDICLTADITVRADAGMLRQVLINLVKNAVEAGAGRWCSKAACSSWPKNHYRDATQDSSLAYLPCSKDW